MTTAASTSPAARAGATVARAAVAIAVVTALARVVGFIRTTVMAGTVGDSAFVGNTYGTANTVPNVVFEIVAGGALASLVVPVLAGAVARGDVERVRAISSALLTWTFVLLVPVAILGTVFARPLMELLTVGVDDVVVRRAEVELGARMLMVFMPQVVLYGIGIVLAGVLQSHRRFLGPAVAPLLSSVVVIAAYLLYTSVRGSGRPGEVGRTEELVLSVGTTLGVVALSLSLVVPVARLRLRLRPSLRMPDGAGRQVRRLAAAGGAGVIAQQAAIVVALVIVNTRPGAVVAYQLAYTVFLLPWGVLAVPLATSAFPALAASADSGRLDEYRRTLAASARAMVLVCAAATAVLWAVRVPLVELLPFDPAGSARAVATSADVSEAVGVLVLGLVPYGLLALLTRALFARGRNAVAAGSTVAGFLSAALVSAVASQAAPDRPVVAVALGHSVGMALAAALLIGGVARDTGRRSLDGVLRSLGAGVVAGAFAAVAGARVAAVFGRPSGAAALSACAAAAGAALLCFGVGLALLRTPELRAGMAATHRRLRRG